MLPACHGEPSTGHWSGGKGLTSRGNSCIRHNSDLPPTRIMHSLAPRQPILVAWLARRLLSQPDSRCWTTIKRDSSCSNLVLSPKIFFETVCLRSLVEFLGYFRTRESALAHPLKRMKPKKWGKRPREDPRRLQFKFNGFLEHGWAWWVFFLESWPNIHRNSPAQLAPL